MLFHAFTTCVGPANEDHVFYELHASCGTGLGEGAIAGVDELVKSQFIATHIIGNAYGFAAYSLEQDVIMC
jgi:hypothetical protein